jgi:hypothetical protein
MGVTISGQPRPSVRLRILAPVVLEVEHLPGRRRRGAADNEPEAGLGAVGVALDGGQLEGVAGEVGKLERSSARARKRMRIERTSLGEAVHDGPKQGFDLVVGGWRQREEGGACAWRFAIVPKGIHKHARRH